MNNDDIRKAYDRLTPDEETKERMLRAIMARSAEMEQEASAKPVIVPWYVRLRVPMGISAAAMACAMVFTLASNNPELVQNGALRQEMLETKPAATTIVTENEVPAETETKPAETTAEAVQTAITASTTAHPLSLQCEQEVNLQFGIKLLNSLNKSHKSSFSHFNIHSISIAEKPGVSAT